MCTSMSTWTVTLHYMRLRYINCFAVISLGGKYTSLILNARYLNSLKLESRILNSRTIVIPFPKLKQIGTNVSIVLSCAGKN